MKRSEMIYLMTKIITHMRPEIDDLVAKDISERLLSEIERFGMSPPSYYVPHSDLSNTSNAELRYEQHIGWSPEEEDVT